MEVLGAKTELGRKLLVAERKLLNNFPQNPSKVYFTLWALNFNNVPIHKGNEMKEELL